MQIPAGIKQLQLNCVLHLELQTPKYHMSDIQLKAIQRLLFAQSKNCLIVLDYDFLFRCIATIMKIIVRDNKTKICIQPIHV